MEISFKRNGKLYNQRYAWFPAQSTSGVWVWLATYYTRETARQGWVILTPFEFLLDTMYGD